MKKEKIKNGWTFMQALILQSILKIPVIQKLISTVETNTELIKNIIEALKAHQKILENLTSVSNINDFSHEKSSSFVNKKDMN